MSVDTDAEKSAKHTNDHTNISKQIPFSHERFQPAGETPASQTTSERVEKVLPSSDTVAEIGAKPINYDTNLSIRNSLSGEEPQVVAGQADEKKELRTTTTVNHNLNNSAEPTSTAEISTISGNTFDNSNSDRAAEPYQQITAVNQQQTKEENNGPTATINNNDPVETLETSAIGSGANPNSSDNYDRVVRLQLEIERLTERIESGLSDSDYDFYMQLKSPVFVIHDRERRLVYQSILEEMLSDPTIQ